MTTSKKSPQKTPEERQLIYDATTKEERLEVVKQRTATGATAGRKSLSVGIAFSKGSEVYQLIEEMSYYFGYPVGAEYEPESNRVTLKRTKEDEMIQWRASEAVTESINDVIKAVVTAIITSEDPSFVSQVRKATIESRQAGYETKTKVTTFFKNLDEYRNATANVREEKKLAKASAALNGLTVEQIRLIAEKHLGKEAFATEVSAA